VKKGENNVRNSVEKTKSGVWEKVLWRLTTGL